MVLDKENFLSMYRKLTPDERVELIDLAGGEFCLYCGREHPAELNGIKRECQCTNDD